MDVAGHTEPDGERAASQKSPDAFRTISEVSSDLDVPQHVLRFWEGKFAQIKPLKRGGGRRYYRPEDVDLLRGIQHLLYGDGYTIKGVQKLLRENGVKYVVAAGRREQPAAKAKPPQPSAPAAATALPEPQPQAEMAPPAVAPPPSAASLGGAPHFAPVVAPVAAPIVPPAPPPPAEPELPLAPPVAPQVAPVQETAVPQMEEPAFDEHAESRRIEAAAKLLARLKALRRDFDTRLQAAKNGR